MTTTHENAPAAPGHIVFRGDVVAAKAATTASAADQSASVSSEALPPAAVVLMVSVRSLANFSR